MFTFSEQQYIAWQMRLEKGRLLRYLVVFFGIYSVLYFFVVGALLLYSGEFAIIARALLAFVLARVIITGLISHYYKKQRPYQRYKLSPIKFSWLLSFKSNVPASFPSGHAIGMASISTVLFAYDFRLGIVGFAMSVLAGIARVLMGYHFMVDVLVGLALGVVAGFIVVAF